MRIACMLIWSMASALQAQTWSQLPDFPGTARDDASAFAIGSDVFVGTGMDVGFALTSDWYKYSTTANTWSPIAALPASGRQYSASFSINGIGYLFGGTDGNALSELWAYDPLSDQWAQRSPLPSDGLAGAVAFTLNGMGYIATGKTAPDFIPTNQLWEYDPVSDLWSQRPSLPSLGRALSSVFVIGDTAYVQGGQLGNGNVVDDLWRYDGSSGTWTQGWSVGMLSIGADGFGLWDRGVNVCGTYDLGAVPYEASTDVYVQNDGGWMWAPPMFTGPGRKGGCGAVVGNVVYYGTGTTGAERLNDWYKLELPIGIQEQEAPAFSLSPVPADALLTVRTEVRDNKDTWALTGSDGRVLLRGTMRSNITEIPTGTLAPGAYLLELSGIHGSATKRFTVMH